MRAAAAAPPGQRVALWFMDGWTRQASNRVGRKGRLCHRLWRRGQRFASAYLFAEVAPVPPEATTVAMTLFLAAFGRNLLAGVHTVPVLDRAGWHGAQARTVPANVTLVHLPPSSPELNPVERVGLDLRERCLSLRVFAGYRAIVAACCRAWNRLAAEPDRLRSLRDQPWIQKVTS